MTFTAVSHRNTANMGDNIRPAEAPGVDEGATDLLVFCHPFEGEFLLFRLSAFLRPADTFWLLDS
jgi:hypothetical protein